MGADVSAIYESEERETRELQPASENVIPTSPAVGDDSYISVVETSKIPRVKNTLGKLNGRKNNTQNS